MQIADRLWERAADRLARRIWTELEDRNRLPLPAVFYDVVVDDPDLLERYEFRDLLACSPRAAAVEAYKRAMRASGFRCVAHHPPGDEQTVAVAPEMTQWSVVHLAGQHPQLSYEETRGAH